MARVGVSIDQEVELFVEGHESTGKVLRCATCIAELKRCPSKPAGKKNNVLDEEVPTKKSNKENLYRVSSQCHKCGQALYKKHTYILHTLCNV